MNAISALSDAHFQVANQTLYLKAKGTVVVMFKANQCNRSAIAEKEYMRLTTDRELAGVNLCILNLTNFRKVGTLSQNTSTPITDTPKFFLYVDGVPRARHKGDQFTAIALKTFILGAIASVNNAQAAEQSAFVDTSRGGIYGTSQPQRSVQQPQIAYQQPQQQKLQVNHSSMANQCDPDDDKCLKSPDSVIPHNTPWEVDIRKLEGRF